MFISHYIERVEIANVEISNGQNSEWKNAEQYRDKIMKNNV